MHLLLCPHPVLPQGLAGSCFSRSPVFTINLGRDGVVGGILHHIIPSRSPKELAATFPSISATAPEKDPFVIQSDAASLAAELRVPVPAPQSRSVVHPRHEPPASPSVKPFMLHILIHSPSKGVA